MKIFVYFFIVQIGSCYWEKLTGSLFAKSQKQISQYYSTQKKTDPQQRQFKATQNQNNIKTFETKTLADYYLILYLQHHDFYLNVGVENSQYERYYQEQIKRRRDSKFDDTKGYHFETDVKTVLPQHLIDYIIYDNFKRLKKDFKSEYMQVQNKIFEQKIKEKEEQKKNTELQLTKQDITMNDKAPYNLQIKNLEQEIKELKDNKFDDKYKNFLEKVFTDPQKSESKEQTRNIKYFLVIAKKYYEMIKMMTGLKEINCYQSYAGNDIESQIKLFNANFDTMTAQINEHKMRGKYKFGKLKRERILGQKEKTFANLESPLKVFENSNFMRYEKFENIVCQPFQFDFHPVFVDTLKFTPIFKNYEKTLKYYIENGKDKIEIESNYPTMVKFLEVPNSWEMFEIFLYAKDQNSVQTLIKKQIEQIRKKEEEPDSISESEMSDDEQYQAIQNAPKINNIDIPQDFLNGVKEQLKKSSSEKIHLQGRVLTEIFESVYFNIDLPIYTGDKGNAYLEFNLYKKNQDKVENYIQYSNNKNPIVLAQYLQLHTFMKSFIETLALNNDWTVDIHECFPKDTSFLVNSNAEDKQNKKSCPIFLKLFFLYMSLEVEKFNADIMIELLEFNYLKKPIDYANQINEIINHLFVFCSIMYDDEDLLFDEENAKKIIEQYIEITAHRQFEKEKENELQFATPLNATEKNGSIQKLKEKFPNQNSQIQQQKNEQSIQSNQDLNRDLIIQLQLQNNK